MFEQKRKHLLQTIRTVLEKGKNITVFGWIGSNHNKKTRNYARTGLIYFVERSYRPTNVGSDLVLLTRFVSHTDQAVLRCKCKEDALYPHTLDIGFLKGILCECDDLFTKKRCKKTQQTCLDYAVQAVDEKVSTFNLNDIEKELLQTEVTVDTFDTFAIRFKEVSQSHHLGHISSQALARILNDFGDVTVRDLTNNSWVIPIRGEGKKRIGWYKPTKKLQDRMDFEKREEPADPIDKAIFLIERRPEIEAEIKLLQGKIAECNVQLKRVELAEELLKKLSEV
jgi:hypothetical protein